MIPNFGDYPHRRRNLLTGDWVLVSPHRTQRPWQGAAETADAAPALPYDPECYLCPGNVRANGERNPDYDGVFVFANDFAALLPDTPPLARTDALFPAETVRGEARVLCFSPDHARTLPELGRNQVRLVVEKWCDQSRELGARWGYVQLFENKGAAMGCSNPHPHGQIWASDFVPTDVAREDKCQRAWRATHAEPLLDQVVRAEIADGRRVVADNHAWLVIVPWWAAWPFETLLIAKSDVRRIEDLCAADRDALAEILRDLTQRYDRLFATSFPYSMGWHGAPHGIDDASHWRLHAHFYPPLLRSATVRKFMVGYEMLAEAQRDLTPEQAAERLRNA